MFYSSISYLTCYLMLFLERGDNWGELTFSCDKALICDSQVGKWSIKQVHQLDLLPSYDIFINF